MSISFEPTMYTSMTTEVPNEVCDVGSAPASGLVVLASYFVLFLILVFTILFFVNEGVIGNGVYHYEPLMLPTVSRIPCGLLMFVSGFACSCCYVLFYMVVLATKQELDQELFLFAHLPEEWSFEDPSCAWYWSLGCAHITLLVTYLANCGVRFVKPTGFGAWQVWLRFNMIIWLLFVFTRAISGHKSVYRFSREFFLYFLILFAVGIGVHTIVSIVEWLWPLMKRRQLLAAEARVHKLRIEKLQDQRNGVHW